MSCLLSTKMAEKTISVPNSVMWLKQNLDISNQYKI